MADVGAPLGVAPPSTVYASSPPAVALRGAFIPPACDGSSGQVLAAAVSVALPLVIVAATVNIHSRFRRFCGRGDAARSTRLRTGTLVACRSLATGEQASASVPSDLYELLGITPKASAANIKQAYYDKMKICHPDIAGPDGEEMCMLLNDAYDTLGNADERAAYDAQLQAASGDDASGAARYFQPNPADLKPVWKRQKRAGRKSPAQPQWNGVPFSRSCHDRVEEEGRGSKWNEAQFVFVDEWSCIACRNCCDVAPQTFCIGADAGRARVFAQWGNCEEDLDYAVTACPVDCIYWVSREDLAVLEFVTRERLYETGNTMPCPMAVRLGNASATVNPFSLAENWKQRAKAEGERRAKTGASRFASWASDVAGRIQAAYSRLSESIRKRGWGG